jgi:hypothetical protein
MDIYYLLLFKYDNKLLDVAKWFKKIYPNRYMLKIDKNNNIKYKIK